MTVTEKAAYIKGLAEGLGLDENNKQDKIIKELIDLVSDMALTVDDIDAGLDELCQQDEDLSDLEGEVYGDDDCCDCDDDDYCCDDDCLEVECPACGSGICIDPSAIDEDDCKIVCPNCKAELNLDFDEDEDEEDDDQE